jgi:hypothetical protein
MRSQAVTHDLVPGAARAVDVSEWVPPVSAAGIGEDDDDLYRELSATNKHDAGCLRRKVEMDMPYICTCGMMDDSVRAFRGAA